MKEKRFKAINYNANAIHAMEILIKILKEITNNWHSFDKMVNLWAGELHLNRSSKST